MNESTVQALKELHSKLQHAGDIKESDRELIQQLQGDIQGLLGKPENDVVIAGHPMIGRLDDATRRLEATHPDITAVIASLVNMLNNMGM